MGYINDGLLIFEMKIWLNYIKYYLFISILYICKCKSKKIFDYCMVFFMIGYVIKLVIF